MKKGQKNRINGALVITLLIAIPVAVMYYFRRKSTKSATIKQLIAQAVTKEQKQAFSAEITQAFDDFLNANSAAYGEQLMVYLSQGNKEYRFKKANNNFDDYSGIASCGKYLTAATVMTLVEEGKIDLDKALSFYLPWLQGKNQYEFYTMRDLLAHNTGIVADSGEFDNKQDIDLDTAVHSIVESNPFQVGIAYPVHYSSTSYKFAARVAEVVSGRKWEALFAERISSKCDMTTTYFNRFTNNPDVGKGAQSSPNDYAHFMEMLRNDGEYNGVSVLTAKSVREMEKLQAGSLEYGLGCWVFPNVSEVAAQGASGTRAWINRTNSSYCVLFTQQDNSAAISTQFKELVRSKL